MPAAAGNPEKVILLFYYLLHLFLSYLVTNIYFYMSLLNYGPEKHDRLLCRLLYIMRQPRSLINFFISSFATFYFLFFLSYILSFCEVMLAFNVFFPYLFRQSISLFYVI